MKKSKKWYPEKYRILFERQSTKLNLRYGLVNAVTAAGKIAKTYERVTDLERIGGEILSLPIPRNILPPPTVSAYQALPEYQSISA